MRRLIAAAILCLAACATTPTAERRAPTEQEFAAAVGVVAATCAIVPQCRPQLCVRGACAACTVDAKADAGRCVLDVDGTTCDGSWTRGTTNVACTSTP